MSKYKIYLKAQGHDDSVIYISPTDQSGNSTKVDYIRKMIAEHLEIQSTHIIIIVAGKILKDDQTMIQLRINDGHTIHAVFKSVAYKQTIARNHDKYGINYTLKNQSQLPKRNVNDEQFGPLAEMDDNYGLTNVQMDDLIKQLMNNPQLLARYMQNPMIEKLCNDQNVLNEIISGNNYLKNKMDKSSAVANIVRTPDSIRPWLEKFKKPDELKKMIQIRKDKQAELNRQNEKIKANEDMDVDADNNEDLKMKRHAQLTELKTLGFFRTDNLQLLMKYGSVNKVVEHYLAN